MANYNNCLARLDEGVGLLLVELKKVQIAEDTLVIYLGDHGAQFLRGQGTVYEGGERIPLIIRWPGHTTAGVVRKALVSTIDLVPTVLAALGIYPASELPGRALQSLFEKRAHPGRRRDNFGLTTGSLPRAYFVRHSMRDERDKLISNPCPGTENLDARTSLEKRHPHFAVSGALPAEQDTAPDVVQEAFRRWANPPRYELYDLKTDPDEWGEPCGNPTIRSGKSPSDPSSPRRGVENA